MTEQSLKRGHIVTFYSFKGGVGRSRAVANTAYQLAHRGKKVLCVDFDLEAPGLSTYFRKWVDKADGLLEDRPGLIDLFYSYRDYLLSPNPFRKIIDWEELLYSIKVDDGRKSFRLDFIGSGRQTVDYGERVTSFDWNKFYEDWAGGGFIEQIREQMRTRYDFILLDSRTGVSDIGGICTIQFPTILVLVFSSSSQSAEGLEKIADNIVTQHKNIAQQTFLPVIPLPSRIDRKEEKVEYDRWFSRIVKSRIGNLLMSVTRGGETVESLLQRITIDYVPWYSFRDELESEKELLNDIGANAWKFSNLVELILRSASKLDEPMRDAKETISWAGLLGEQNTMNDKLENSFLAHPSKQHITSEAARIDVTLLKSTSGKDFDY